MDQEQGHGKMKAIVSKVTGETLLFIPEDELNLVQDRSDVLIIDAIPCQCGKGWIIKRKREVDHENY